MNSSVRMQTCNPQDAGRRALQRSAAALLGCAALLWLSACDPAPTQAPGTAKEDARIRHWNLQPTDAGERQAAELFARKVEAMSGGRLKIAVARKAGERRALERFNSGVAQIIHSGIIGASERPALQFFVAAPFGMSRQELGAWLYYGGGMELLEELYAPLQALPLPGGGVGMSLGGWFNRPLRSVADLRGLKVQASGLAAEAYRRLGSVPRSVPEFGLYAQLRAGELDAATSPGPEAGLRARLHTLGGYCYYPGWQAPGTMRLFLIRRDAFEDLPAPLQTIVRTAAKAVDQEMLERYNTRNADALQELRQVPGVQFLPFPENLMRALYRASREVTEELAAGDPAAQRVYRSYREFFEQVRPWHETSDLSAMNLRRPE